MRLTWRLLTTCFLTGICLALAAVAGNAQGTAAKAAPASLDLGTFAPAELWEATGGAVEGVGTGPDQVLRWAPAAGQTALLSMRPTHALFGRLRYFDRLRFEFRVAQGEIQELGLEALGHVSGPRQYKVHQWGLALRTTERGKWHTRDIDLARPNWFPWDIADGQGEEGYFRLSALALLPGTVIELRHLRLTRGLITVKPDYDLQITWPQLTRGADGSVSYTVTYQVLNSSGRPATITAAVRSSHSKFDVKLDQAALPAKLGEVVTFTLTGTMSAAAIAATPELYAEPLQVEFGLSSHPEATIRWQGELVRPLSATLRRQVVFAQADLDAMRGILRDGPPAAKSALAVEPILATADELLGKRLEHIPTGSVHVTNGYPGDWRPGDAMPEAVDTKAGAREYATDRAGHVWKEYLGFSGQACDRLGTAYLLTGDEKYARKAIELLALYARQYVEMPWRNMFDPPWNRGPDILCSSRAAGNSTYGSNWYFKGHCRLLSMVADSPSWTPEQRRDVYERFVVPYAAELMKFPGGISNQTDITNHNVMLLGAACDDAGLVRWAAMRDSGLLARLGDIDADGFSSEGRALNYHYAEMAEYLPSVAYLANCGLALPLPRERLLAALRMPYARATLWGRVPNSGDCGRGMAVGPTSMADPLSEIMPQERWLVDIGNGTTLVSRLRRLQAGGATDPRAWERMLDPKPRLFAETGMAVLRSGETPDSQIMLTLDYGRNLFHGALDRNQVTLAAFGLTFTHGPGSLYNAGAGGMTRNTDAALESFCTHDSIGQNVIVVDAQNQLPAIGRLLAWHDDPKLQVAGAIVEGIQPGVSHTRVVALTSGLAVVLDRIEGAGEHTYDFVYHNLGRMTPGPGWSATALDKPLAETGNYGNLVAPKRLSGSGPIRLTWDLSPASAAAPAPEPRPLLDLWQTPPAGSEAFVCATGMNNPNTMVVPDAAPTLITRVRGKTASFVTVLEPGKGAARVKTVEALGADGVRVTLAEGERVELSMAQLLRAYATPRGGQ